MDLARAACNGLRKHYGNAVAFQRDLMADPCTENLREAWAAMAMLREAVETFGPIGCMRSAEHVSCNVAPTFTAEAYEILAGIMAIVNGERNV